MVPELGEEEVTPSDDSILVVVAMEEMLLRVDSDGVGTEVEVKVLRVDSDGIGTEVEMKVVSGEFMVLKSVAESVAIGIDMELWVRV